MTFVVIDGASPWVQPEFLAPPVEGVMLGPTIPFLNPIRDFLLGLPSPWGMIVTGVLPPIAIAGFFGILFGYRARKQAVAVVSAAILIISVVGMLAFAGGPIGP